MMVEVWINRTVCPFCGLYLMSFEEAMEEVANPGTVADEFTVGHIRMLKRHIDHIAHAHLMERRWAEMEGG